jgi:hypothetical protein
MDVLNRKAEASRAASPGEIGQTDGECDLGSVLHDLSSFDPVYS